MGRQVKNILSEALMILLHCTHLSETQVENIRKALPGSVQEDALVEQDNTETQEDALVKQENTNTQEGALVVQVSGIVERYGVALKFEVTMI